MRYKSEDQIAIYCLQLRPPIRIDSIKKQENDDNDYGNDDNSDDDGTQLRHVMRGPGVRSGLLAASSFAGMKQEGNQGKAGKSKYRSGCLLLLIVPTVCPRV
jgi:hypothetical protein